MSIEASCFQVKRRGEDTLIRSDSVQPGASEPLPYLQKIQILATCDVDSSVGTIRVKTTIRRNRQLSVMLFEGKEDEDGRNVPYDGPIKITGEQELSIFYKKQNREVVIYLNQEDRFEERTPPIDVDRLTPVR